MSKLRGVSYFLSSSRHIRSTQLCGSVSTSPFHRSLVTFSPQLQNLIPLVPHSLCGVRSVSNNAEGKGDYTGVGPIIEKLEKWKIRYPPNPRLDNRREQPTDSDSDEDDDRFSPDAIRKRADDFQKKFARHKELLKSFTNSKTLDESFEWMNRLDKFEQKHLKLRPEYIVIGELMNRLKEATGKDKFLLQQKLNRAMRLVDWKEANDPNNPENYGVFKHADEASLEDEEWEKEQATRRAQLDDDDDMEFNSMKERDDILLAKLEAIDRKLEQKLADLDHTFGKKGMVLEEEIRDLAEERNSLTEQKRRPLYRKGFDVKLLDVKRTSKVTKGGRVFRYSALLACGNYHGVIGFAMAKGEAMPAAVQKAHQKCFENLHYIERHEEHTIAHAVQTSYKKTKLYLWPGNTLSGMSAGKVAQTVLNLAGFKNVKSKVIGSRNTYNTVKALFKALNAIETPKDVQQKFGRTVVESYLL